MIKDHLWRCKWRYVIGAFVLGILLTLAFVPLWMLAQPVNMAIHAGDTAEMAQPEAAMSQAGEKADTLPQLVQTAYADGGSKIVIDVGYSQGYFDWDSVAGQIDGAILEAGYGNDSYDQDDWTLARNVAECERLGIPYGIYLYSYASNDSMAYSEADHILRLARTCNPTLGVVIDVEDPGIEYYYRRAAEVVCQQVEAAGYHAIWYSGAYNASSTGLSSLPYDAWVADYTPPLDYSGSVIGWQYTNSGVAGVDTSYWYSDAATPNPGAGNAGGNSGGGARGDYDVDEIAYRVSTQAGGVLPEMVGTHDTGGSSDTFAGDGSPITYLAMNFPGWYQVKTEASGWLPTVNLYNIYDTINGCAGDGSPIVAVRCYYETQDSSNGWYVIEYSVNGLEIMRDLSDTGGSSDDFAGNGARVTSITAFKAAA